VTGTSFSWYSSFDSFLIGHLVFAAAFSCVSKDRGWSSKRPPVGPKEIPSNALPFAGGEERKYTLVAAMEGLENDKNSNL
jgi:hypothetical protein